MASWEVLCLGDTLTRGRLGADWVRPLEASTKEIASRGAPVRVFNEGADSALAESLLGRLHAALRRHPEAHALVLLLGTNDILAHLHPLPHHLLKLQNGFRGEFLGPREFAEAVAAAVRTLPRGMPVAVLGIPPIGEDLDCTANAAVRQYNAALEVEVARARSATFVDLYAAFSRVLRAAGHAAGPVKPASRAGSVLGRPTGKQVASDDASATASVADMVSRQSSAASSSGGLAAAAASRDAGFKEVTLRDGEPLPDVIELDGPADLGRMLAAQGAAKTGVPGTGRDSIGKTSLRAAAKAAGVKRASAGASHVHLTAAALGARRNTAPGPLPDSYGQSFQLEEPHAPTLAEIQEHHRREASLGFNMPAWPLTVAGALLRHWLLRASWDAVADANGLLLLTDNVHLSERGATIVAGEVRGFLERVLIPARPSAYASAAGHHGH